MKRCLYFLSTIMVFLGGCESDSRSSSQRETMNTQSDQSIDRLDMGDVTVSDAQVDAQTDQTVGPDTREASFDVRGTLGMIYVWNAPVQEEMEVVSLEGEVIASAQTDELGSIVIRDLAPASELTVRVKESPEDRATQVRVLSQEELPPDESLYASQTLIPGNQYITMRDGTQLHIFVSLPGPIEDGPYPTVVNYSGYSPGRPGRKLSDVVEPM